MINLANTFFKNKNRRNCKKKKSAGLKNMHMSNLVPAHGVKLNGTPERKMEFGRGGGGGGVSQ
jgi:hypothetical protein